jgi:hypothetical protein
VIGHAMLYGTRLSVHREIVARTGRARVEVRDVIRNDGRAPVGVPLLYHVNLGAPLLAPHSRLILDGSAGPVTTRLRETLPSGRDPLAMPEPSGAGDAVVAEHREVRVEPDGRSRAVLEAPAGPRVVVDWTAPTLPRLCTWAWPERGAWVLGVEPTNAPLFGPERDGPFGGAPVLGPGEEWRTAVAVEIVPVDAGQEEHG